MKKVNILRADLVLIQQRQADGSGRVDVGMEERRLELALGRSGRIVVLEEHSDLQKKILNILKMNIIILIPANK